MLTAAALLAIASVALAQNCSVDPETLYLDQSGVNAQVHDSMPAWFKDKVVWFFDFGPYSSTAGPASNPASVVSAIPIYVPMYPNKTKAGNNIIDILPCQAGYSDLWNVTIVNITDSTVAYNTFTDVASVQAAVTAGQATLQPGVKLVNCPVVPFNSTSVDRSPNSPPQSPVPTTGWYKQKPVFYFDFGPVDPALVNTQGVWHLNTASGKPEGSGIFDVLGTPFWNLKLVEVPENLAGTNQIRSLAEITAGNYKVNSTNLIVNCPIVYVASSATPASTGASVTTNPAPTAGASTSTTATKSTSGASSFAKLPVALLLSTAFVMAMMC